MPNRLTGKTALLTAAGQGIGRATAEAFIAEGATVIATDLRLETLQGLNCQTAALDVNNKQAVFDLIGSLPRLDVLFNCPGFVHHGTLLEVSDSDWEFSFNLNVRSMFWSMQAAIPKMLEGGGGSIINISSVASSIKGAPNRFVYGASKAAIIGMTKSVAADFVTKRIRCNAICPGTVESPSWRERVDALAKTSGVSQEEAKQAFVSRQPMGRVGKAEEIAALAVYLASEGVSQIWGKG